MNRYGKGNGKRGIKNHIVDVRKGEVSKTYKKQEFWFECRSGRNNIKKWKMRYKKTNQTMKFWNLCSFCRTRHLNYNTILESIRIKGIYEDGKYIIERMVE
jgi:hypothetical protein